MESCSRFQPQLWRPEVCKDCFRGKREHHRNTVDDNSDNIDLQQRSTTPNTTAGVDIDSDIDVDEFAIHGESSSNVMQQKRRSAATTSASSSSSYATRRQQLMSSTTITIDSSSSNSNAASSPSAKHVKKKSNNNNSNTSPHISNNNSKRRSNIPSPTSPNVTNQNRRNSSKNNRDRIHVFREQNNNSNRKDVSVIEKKKCGKLRECRLVHCRLIIIHHSGQSTFNEIE
jgi:hypothetical protein